MDTFWTEEEGFTIASFSHQKLVDMAVTKLMEKYKFSEDQIKLNYYVKDDEGAMLVDVVGIRPSLRVAVECGKARINKIARLKKLFDRVERIPYTAKVSPHFEGKSCAICGSPEALCKHHISYRPERTVTLCCGCHRMIHGFLRTGTSQIGVPPSIIWTLINPETLSEWIETAKELALTPRWRP